MAAELQQQLTASQAHTELVQQQLVAEQLAADAKVAAAERAAALAAQQLGSLEDECGKLGQEIAELQAWPLSLQSFDAPKDMDAALQESCFG